MEMAGKKDCSNSETIFNNRKIINETDEEKQNSLDFLFSSLLAGLCPLHSDVELVLVRLWYFDSIKQGKIGRS